MSRIARKYPEMLHGSVALIRLEVMKNDMIVVLSSLSRLFIPRS